MSAEVYTAKVGVTPEGEITLVPGEVELSVHWPVEIAWYPDRLRITALGAGRAAVTEGYAGGHGQDVVVEIRPPSLDDVPETVPGAD